MASRLDTQKQAVGKINVRSRFFEKTLANCPRFGSRFPHFQRGLVTIVGKGFATFLFFEQDGSIAVSR